MNILDAAISAAWAMEESALAGLLEVAAREHSVTPEALAAYRAEALKKADRATMRDGVAILSVEGPLFKRANLMTELCGATSYATLMRDLQAAVDDEGVRAILLNVDSPGGEASGVSELAGAVRAVRGKKPIVAYAGDLAASAAYWIGSAADRLVIGQGAALGSIGVRMTIPDTSERDARTGLRRFDFVSSQSPFKVSDPSKKDGAARIRARIDALAQVFVDAVAENRGVTAAHVLESFGKGDVLIGKAAIAAGMADSFGTFESTLAALAAEGNPFAGFGLPRAAARGPGTLKTPAMTEEQHKAGVTAAVAAERERAAGLNAATFAGYETARDEAIRSGSSVAAFRVSLVEQEHAKAAARARAIGTNVDRNSMPPNVEPKEGPEAVVEAILAAHKLVAGH